MSKPIHQTVTFKASAKEIYEALMDSIKHSEFTHSKASISRTVGGTISAYDGYITGKNIELIPDEKIVQDWRAVDWPEDFFSSVIFKITPVQGGARLDFTQMGVPEGTEEEFSQGWIDNYWVPMKAYLEK
jgi:activator of HSP90 ATPase